MPVRDRVQISKLRLILPAGNQESIPMVGEFMYIESSNQAFEFRTEEGDKAPLKAGARVTFNDQYQSIDFKNDLVDELDAVIVYGIGNYEDDSFTGSVNVSSVDPFTSLTPQPALGMTGAVQVAAAASPLRKRLVLVADPANVNPIWLGGVAGEGIQLGANESWEEYYNGAISVLGTIGDTLNILEVF